MTSKADRLKKVVDEVTCVKCRVNPRFGSLQRCKQCLRADAEVERVARERLLPARAAPRPNRSQAAASSSATRTKARKAKPVATTPAGKALVTARPAQPVLTKQTRQHRPRRPR